MPPGQVVVELTRNSDPMPLARAVVGGGGDFEFGGLPAGVYELRVMTLSGAELSRQIAMVDGGHGTHMMVRLPESKTQRPPGGSISVDRLQANIPKKARKEFDRAIRATKEGNHPAAIEHLEKALAEAPDYVEARNNLAAQYLRLGRYQEAVDELRKAAEIAPGESKVFTNLAAGYLHLEDYPAAERAARQAFRADPTDPKARYVLGLALASLGDAEPAVHYLNSVVEEIPRARLALARVLEQDGNPEGAAAEIRLYLAAGASGEAAVDRWLEELEQEEPAAAGGQ